MYIVLNTNNNKVKRVLKSRDYRHHHHHYHYRWRCVTDMVSRRTTGSNGAAAAVAIRRDDLPFRRRQCDVSPVAGDGV